VLAVWVVYALGCRLRDRMAGLIAGLVFAVCPLHVWYSQEVRMYAVQTLFVCLSWLWLLRALERKDTGSWLIYALATAASLYTQYSSLFSLVAQNVFVFWTRRESGLPVRMWLRAQAAVAVLFLPWLPIFWHHWQGRTFGYWLRPLAWPDPLRFFALLSGAIQHNPGPYWPWIIVSAVVLGLALWACRPVALIGWLFLPVALLAAQSVGANVFLARALVFVAPAFALLIGVAAAQRRGLWIAAGVLLAANALALRTYFVAPNDWLRSPARDAALRVADAFQPGDVVVHTSRFSYRPFQWYIGDRVTQGLVRETEEMPALFQVIGSSRLPDNLDRFRRVWLVEWPDFQQGLTGAPRVSLRVTGAGPPSSAPPTPPR
jgi:mannosyltransferase